METMRNRREETKLAYEASVAARLPDMPTEPVRDLSKLVVNIPPELL